MERQLEWRWGPRHDRRAAKKKRRLTKRHKVEMRTDDPSPACTTGRWKLSKL